VSNTESKPYSKLIEYSKLIDMKKLVLNIVVLMMIVISPAISGICPHSVAGEYPEGISAVTRPEPGRISGKAVSFEYHCRHSDLEPVPVKLPTHRDHMLGNGMRVCVAEMHEVPIVSFMLFLPAGSVFDPPGYEGLANFTALLLDKGAGGMSAEEISDKVASVGGELSISAERDYAMVMGDFLSGDIAMALHLAATIVKDPTFSPGEIEKQREIILANIDSEVERPYSLANREFGKFLLEDHPYGHPVNGYIKTVKEMERDDIVGFYRKHYLPRGSVLAVAGDIEGEDILERVREEFGGWEENVGMAAITEGIDTLRMGEYGGETRKILVINKPGITQSQIRIGNIAVGQKTPYYFPLLLANTILGGGFTSRLMDEIRVKRGLSYGAGSYLSQYGFGGYFGVYTFTKNNTLRETIDVALAEIDKMRNAVVGEEELEKAVRYLGGLFPFDVETSVDVAWWLARIRYYHLNRSFVEDYRKEIAAVSSGDVWRAVKKFFHSKDCSILILTDYEETKDQLKGLGQIELREMDQLE
jgi:zinc protease